MCKFFFSFFFLLFFKSLIMIDCFFLPSRWNPSGILIGKFGVAGRGSANFAFVPNGMYIQNELKLWFISIAAEGRTMRRDFGLVG